MASITACEMPLYWSATGTSSATAAAASSVAPPATRSTGVCSWPPRKAMARQVLGVVMVASVTCRWSPAHAGAASQQPLLRRVEAARSSRCHSEGCATGITCTAVTLYSGQLVAQSEFSVVTTLAPDSGKWKVV